ncbi:MAG: hypothetical protein IH945_05425 [Armatimonadetes bacterium]|nr:hypothetical protein [Armatimonadota bacterium]
MDIDEPIRPEPEEAPAKEEPELPEKPSEKDLEEAGRLLQQASLAMIRGHGSVAERLTDEAAEVAPGSAAVQVALGDLLWGRKQYKKARDKYHVAHLLEPDNAGYETKWAESLLGSAGDPESRGTSRAEVYASAKTGAVLSFIIPGLGQIVMGEVGKGLTMMSLWAGGWTWAFLVPNGLSGLPHAFGLNAKVDTFNALVLVPIGIATIAWLWSLTSAGSRAKSYQARTIERPVPPGEGDF